MSENSGIYYNEPARLVQAACMHMWRLSMNIFFYIEKTYCTFQKNINAFLSVWKNQTKKEARD